MKLKLKKQWITVQKVLQRSNIALLRHTDKFSEFRIAVNNRLRALQDLLKEQETTVEDNWKGIKEALTSTRHKILGCKKHRHKGWISTEILDKIEERKNKKTAIDNNLTRAEKVKE
ncbi:unnamed protein product [Schistosoma mattheei]|uniref:Uncharacterized protein n=1 Tax=Schistosoma mattheei TaxID=31246 RepID=A0A183NSJ5_9TREM|nr:unnamed protein product [Schistosoma mattheei]